MNALATNHGGCFISKGSATVICKQYLAKLLDLCLKKSFSFSVLLVFWAHIYIAFLNMNEIKKVYTINISKYKHEIQK